MRRTPPSRPTTPAAEPLAADPVRRAETWALGGQAGAGQLAALLVALVVTWALTPTVPLWLAGGWLLGVLAVTVARMLDLQRGRPGPAEVFSLPVVRRHRLWTAGAGILWGVPPWLLWPEPALEPLFVVTLAILGLTAGAAVAYAPMRGHFELFATPSVASLGLRLLIGSEVHLVAAAALCPIYLAAMAWLAGKRRDDAVALAATDALLASLHRAASHPGEGLQESLRDLLATGCHAFGLDVGLVARLEGEAGRVLAIHSLSGQLPLVPGERFALSEASWITPSDVEGRSPAGATIAQTILVDGEPFGVVRFYDPRRRHFRIDLYKKDLVGLMAEWLGSELGRRRSEQETVQQRRRLELLTDSVPAMIAYLTPDHRYAYVNSQYERFFGRSRESFAGASLRSVTGEESYEGLRPYLDRAMAGEEQWFEFSPDLPDGRSTTFSVHYVPDWSDDHRVRGCFALLTEVTAYKETEVRLLEEVRRDFLTGLLNRRGFLTAVSEMLGDQRKRAGQDFLCFLDLDRFKVVNDQAGHQAGDAALRHAAALMRGQVRSSDLLARIGGDEFGLLLTGCTEAEAHQLLGRLRQCVVESPFTWNGRSFSLGVSIGAVAFNRARHRVEELLREADEACYLAKRGAEPGVVVAAGSSVANPEDPQ